jgi:hypothetical protein
MVLMALRLWTYSPMRNARIAARNGEKAKMGKR